jgi:hypothetical protein
MGMYHVGRMQDATDCCGYLWLHLWLVPINAKRGQEPVAWTMTRRTRLRVHVSLLHFPRVQR